MSTGQQGIRDQSDAFASEVVIWRQGAKAPDVTDIADEIERAVLVRNLRSRPHIICA